MSNVNVLCILLVVNILSPDEPAANIGFGFDPSTTPKAPLLFRGNRIRKIHVPPFWGHDTKTLLLLQCIIKVLGTKQACLLHVS